MASILRAPVDQQVLQQVREEIKDKKLVAKMVEAAHATAAAIDTSPASLINALRAVEQKISKLVDMAADTGNRSLVAKLEELEAERDRLQQERATLAEREKLKQGLRNLRTRDVEAMLEFAAKPLDGQEIDLLYLRKTLAALVRRVELDPTARTTRVEYRVGLSGAKLASPRGCNSGSGEFLTLVSSARLPTRAPRSAQGPARRRAACQNASDGCKPGFQSAIVALGDYFFVGCPSMATAGGHGFTLRALLRNAVICPAIPLFSSISP